MSNIPSEQHDTKTQMELLEEYLTNRIEHLADNVSKGVDTFDIERLGHYYWELKETIRTLDWLRSKSFINKWQLGKKPRDYINKYVERRNAKKACIDTENNQT